MMALRYSHTSSNANGPRGSTRDNTSFYKSDPANIKLNINGFGPYANSATTTPHERIPFNHLDLGHIQESSSAQKENLT
jgi:hypothetical protein